ncbi:glycosyltransferase family 2 protein [Acidobacteriota bacterium]
MKNKVAILILNWNGWQDTLECLESVRLLSYPNYQIIVLDNGSTDDSIEKIKAWCRGSVHCVEYDTKTAEIGGRFIDEAKLNESPPNKRLVLIQSQKNLGFAEGNNVAVKYALRCHESADYVFLLNNDTYIDKNCLSYSMAVSREKKASVVTCVVKEAGTGKLLFTGDHRPPWMFYVSYFWFRHKLQNDEPSNMAWGTAMMIKKDALDDMERQNGDVFDPQLFLYSEDNDFSMRMIDLGYRIYLASKAFVFHKQTDSCVKKKYGNSFLLYYSTRNTILVARRNISGIWLLLFHLYYPTIRLKDLLFRLFRGQYREASNILEGFWDGYRNVSGKWRKHA